MPVDQAERVVEGARHRSPYLRKRMRAAKLMSKSVFVRELLRNRSKSLDTPNWLWSSVVELLADHERAYLEHCRRYARESN